jgi:Helix-turn-helix domain
MPLFFYGGDKRAPKPPPHLDGGFFMFSAMLGTSNNVRIPMSQTVPTAQRGRVRLSDAWMGTAAAAKRADVTSASIVRWASEGLLSGRKVVGRWRIDPRDLDRLLAGQEADSAE